MSYMAFERRAISHLLDDRSQKYLDPIYPLFYKNPDQRSAIDTALDLNQIQSVNKMIEFITKYQNSFVYAHLFTYNLIDLLQKNVACAPLFNSQILNHQFQYYEWPSLHSDTDKCFAPYNKSMFKIRYEYKNLFPKQYNMDIEYKAKVEKFKADHLSEDNYSQDGNFGKSNKQIDRARSA